MSSKRPMPLKRISAPFRERSTASSSMTTSSRFSFPSASPSIRTACPTRRRSRPRSTSSPMARDWKGHMSTTSPSPIRKRRQAGACRPLRRQVERGQGKPRPVLGPGEIGRSLSRRQLHPAGRLRREDARDDIQELCRCRKRHLPLHQQGGSLRPDGSHRRPDAYVEASQGAYTAVANRIQDETIDAYSLYSYFLERDPRYFSGDKLEVTSGSFVNKMAKFDLNPATSPPTSSPRKGTPMSSIWMPMPRCKARTDSPTF